MAFKLSVWGPFGNIIMTFHSGLVLFLLLFLSQTVPTSQLYIPSDEIPKGPREPHYLPYKPRDNSTLHVVNLESMSQSLWDSGYKIASLLLKRELPNLVPYAYGTHLDPFYKEQNDIFYSLLHGVPVVQNATLYLYDENAVTVFAPPDEAFGFRPWMSLEYQLVLGKVEEEGVRSGVVSKGLKMATCDSEEEYVVVTGVEEANGLAFVNDVRVTKWNIYNDGHLFVHGVDNFFDPRVFHQYHLN